MGLPHVQVGISSYLQHRLQDIANMLPAALIRQAERIV